MGLMDWHRSIPWETTLGPYRIACTMTEEPRDTFTLVVVENGVELERETVTTTPETWSRPWERAEALRQKHYARSIEGMRPHYLQYRG